MQFNHGRRKFLSTAVAGASVAGASLSGWLGRLAAGAPQGRRPK
jgi:hypothetical protein